MHITLKAAACLLAIAYLPACTSGAEDDTRSAETFDRIAEGESVSAGGTEPFWSVQIEGSEAVFSTPENIDGTAFAVSRFAGNSGLAFTGAMDGEEVVLTVTEGMCSDNMSDYDYPFTATLQIGERLLEGCATSDSNPKTGSESL
ncbi:COG3650 family protein [Paraurantiacibacter namhicola]|uniref:Lipoprotein n=1 Tax=Paraurantiacibacter namhicola TaxID=645517 RepID=A0A1C7D711_9SPHN|nr:hypothetical protein [Paraurantiacibacter namhicola]ANU07276.1 hypothetical protein A6F65_00966 [Paraurantiacibacter namhicola]